MASIEKIIMEENGDCEFWLKIKNFTPDLGETGKSINCNFVNHAGSWQLEFYPKGLSKENQNYMSFFVQLTANWLYHVNAFWEFFIVDNCNNVKRHFSFDYGFDLLARYGWNTFVSRASLFDKSKEFINNDEMILHGRLLIKNEKFPLEDPTLPIQYSLKPGLRQILFSDIVIKVEGQLIKAHKVFLAEASRKFYRLLSHNEAKKTLEVLDLKFDVADQMIKYIYEDKVEDIARYAGDLLIAANVYEYRKLKKYCEKYFFDNLTVENAVETLIFATKHYASELKSECIGFVARHISEIAKTDWEAFINSHPDTFDRLFKQCVYTNFSSISDYFQNNFVKFVEVKTEFPEQAEFNWNSEFAYLYLNPVFSDIDLEVDGSFLKAHKAILSSRSPEFKTIFYNDILNKKRHQIKDFKVDTIKELLRWIYCEKVENLEEIALDLLRAADKFKIPKLGKICESFLEKIISVHNVTKIMNTAQRANCIVLKDSAISFFGRNILEVMETPEWLNLIRKNSKLLNEIFMEIVRNIIGRKTLT